MFLSAGVLKETSSLLETARTMKEYMEYLGFAYIMTEDDKYFNKAMEQMDACEMCIRDSCNGLRRRCSSDSV